MSKLDKKIIEKLKKLDSLLNKNDTLLCECGNFEKDKKYAFYTADINIESKKLYEVVKAVYKVFKVDLLGEI